MGRHATLLMMLGLVALSLGVRLPRLGAVGYQPDELWTAEIATGRGSAHLALPLNVFRPIVDLYDLHTAPPWWQVWTHMQCTHPPLYFTLLRLWMNTFGTGDGTERLLSVFASTAAVLLLFDTARRLNGVSIAMWAAVLMAVAEPQVDHARLTRNYVLLLATTLAAANLLVRIEQSGEGCRRLFVGLSLAILATLLTHYFCVGALAAMFGYAAFRLRGKPRRSALLAFVAAGAVYAIVWGPFLWQQRALFSTSDDATLFLHEADPAHVARTVHRFLMVPAGMLLGPRGALLGVPTALGLLYLSPLWTPLRRGGLLLWMIWLWAVPLPLLGLDLFRQTAHLGFVRYSLLSGPAVFVLIPALSTCFTAPWMRAAIPAAAVVFCLASLSEVFHNPVVLDPHLVAENLPPLTRDDRIVCSAPPGEAWQAGESYLLLCRYVRPLACPVALIDHPAPPALQPAARASRRLFVLSQTVDELYWPWPRMALSQRRFLGRAELSQWMTQPAPTP